MSEPSHTSFGPRIRKGSRRGFFSRWYLLLLVPVCVLGLSRVLSHLLRASEGKRIERLPEGAAAAHKRPVIGYNLDYPGDWSPAMPFLDLIHDSRHWAAGDERNTAMLHLDAHGWPMRLDGLDGVTSILHTKGSPGFVGHTWVVTYRGRGNLTVDGAIDVLDQKPGRIRFRGKDGNVWLTIRATDPDRTGDYIRDISVVREDRQELVEKGEIFNPDLLSFLAPYHSLRFMDWMLSNSEEKPVPNRWAARSKLTQPQWGSQFIDPRNPAAGTTVGGYPPEIMIALANRLHAHPHFDMPYRYDEQYVREFARLVRKTLDPSLTATVEYSNEVWNWNFPQATFAKDEAAKRWPGEGTGWLQYAGMRTSEMCRMWKEEFAGQLHRLRCVIAPQTGWIDVASAVLDCPRWAAEGHPPCFKSADAIAISGYFDGLLPHPENVPVIKAWLSSKGKSEAMNLAFRQLEFGDVAAVRDGDKPSRPEDAHSLQNTISAFVKFRRLADAHGLGLYVYEGGTHFDHGPDETVRRFLVDLTHDARMKSLYLKLFEGFQGVGGSVFNVWGGVAPDSAWANADSLMDRQHPKYQAALEFASAPVRP